jgi:predicted DNA-binding protein
MHSRSSSKDTWRLELRLPRHTKERLEVLSRELGKKSGKHCSVNRLVAGIVELYLEKFAV